MTHRTIKKGYVALAKSRREILSGKYPFSLLTEGDYVDPPYPLAELDRVRSAVRHFNRTRGACLHVNVHTEGLNGNGPCVQVGWPKGGKVVKTKKRGVKRS